MKKISLSPKFKKAARNGKRAADKVAKAMKVAKKRFEEAERSGSVEKWRNRVALGVQALETAVIAAAAYKGASVRIGKTRAPAKRTGSKRKSR